MHFSMSEERLSKLQKWILKHCFEKGKSFIRRQALLKEYRQNRNLDLDSAEAALTKSLRNLRDKGYIELLDTGYNSLFNQDDVEGWGIGESFDERLHKVKYVSLTEEGIRRATQSPSEET